MAKNNNWLNGNGKWSKQVWGGWPGETKKGGKVLVDWACGICDLNADPAYQGCYANQHACPTCKTEKRLAHHMTMETRRARLQAGTLKAKEQARAERVARKNGDSWHTTAGGKQTGIFDEKAADEKIHAQLLLDLMGEKSPLKK